jgi:hypothetical protein
VLAGAPASLPAFLAPFARVAASFLLPLTVALTRLLLAPSRVLASVLASLGPLSASVLLSLAAFLASVLLSLAPFLASFLFPLAPFLLVLACLLARVLPRARVLLGQAERGRQQQRSDRENEYDENLHDISLELFWVVGCPSQARSLAIIGATNSKSSYPGLKERS